MYETLPHRAWLICTAPVHGTIALCLCCAPRMHGADGARFSFLYAWSHWHAFMIGWLLQGAVDHGDSWPDLVWRVGSLDGWHQSGEGSDPDASGWLAGDGLHRWGTNLMPFAAALPIPHAFCTPCLLLVAVDQFPQTTVNVCQ